MITPSKSKTNNGELDTIEPEKLGR
jgi:hypothetical protein